MGAGLAFPEVFIGVSSADPADPNTVDVWSDLAIRTWQVRQAQAGKQYELGQSVAGRMNAHFRNVDEYLNPANTTSPLYAYAKPWRQTRFMGSYPNGAPLGNMWNSLNGRDGSFETGLTGVLPSWLVGVATAPTVVASTPHGGTRSLQYTVANNTTPQGVATTPFETLPGRVHTAFGFVRQSTGSTQQIAVGGLTAADRYNRTGALSGSTADQGGTWSISGGVSGDYTTTAAAIPQVNGTATIGNGSVNVARHATLGVAAQDYDVRCWLSVPVVAVGASIIAGLVGNFTDASNHYRYHLVFNTNGTVDAQIQKDVAATVTTLATTTGVDAYAAGARYWIRAQKTGSTLNLKVWRYGTPEPTTWTVTATDAAITAAQALGLRSILTTGNTNTTPAITYGPLAVTNYLTPGQTTTTSGAYVQLAVTFTATQPYHYIQWNTIGTALSGTVNLDDLQCNRGNTAQAVTTTGPLVRGIWGGHVERLPITWIEGTNGYEGAVDAPCVGDLAAMSRTKIRTDAVTAFLSLGPALYYPMWEPSGATQYADASGNGGPPLITWNSPIGGAATAPTPGSANNAPGDPGGTGVAYQTGVAGTGPNDTGTLFGAGAAFRTASPNFPSTATGQSFSCSAAAWVQITWPFPAGSATDGFAFKAATFLPTNSNQISFCDVSISAVDGSITGFFIGPAGAFTVSSAAGAMTDNKPHLITVVVQQVAGGSTIMDLYVDQTHVDNQFQATSVVGQVTAPLTSLMVGGRNDGTSTTEILGGTISHVGWFTRALSINEVGLLNSALRGNIGEKSGARVQRYLSSYHPDPSPTIDLNTMSLMGAPSAVDKTPLSTALQRIQDTEAGSLFENRDGGAQFDGREIRYLRTAPTVVFGENVGAGQIPYTEKGGGPPTFDYDTTQMYNQAVISRTGGIKAIANPDTSGSTLTFYQNEYDLTVDCQTDSEAIDHGNWVVANFQQPKLRVRTLTVDLGAIPSLFPQIMNLEKGVRVTVVRVAKAGNSGAGVTMSNDYFIENINHHDIDPELGSWMVDLQMSPVPLQPWILGDTTYSVLGSTTILGF